MLHTLYFLTISRGQELGSAWLGPLLRVSQGFSQDASWTGFLILVPQLEKDILSCLHGYWQNSALCSYRSESFRWFLFGVVVLVVLLLLASRGCPQFLATWSSPTWLFASSQPTRERHSGKMDAKVLM